MKRYLTLLVALAALSTMVGCASVRTDAASKTLAQVDDIATGAMETRAAVIELDGEPALLYVTKDNRVVFRYGAQLVRMDETAQVRGGTSYQLQLQDQHLHAVWWSHENAKNLYMTSSTDLGRHFAPVTTINDSHGVLPFFSLLQGPQGVLGVTYQDERNQGYQTYFNRSTDYGRTWPKPDQRLDVPLTEGRGTFVQEPQSVESGTVWVSAWVDAVNSAEQTSYRIISRRSEDAGLNWSPPTVVHSSGTTISSLKVRALGNTIVIGADAHGSGIIAYTSQDQGRTWRGTGYLAGTGFKLGTEGANNSGLDLSIVGNHAVFVWMQDRKPEKTKIMRASLDIGQATWIGTVQRLDQKAHDNTRSISPVVLAGSKGPVVAAWVDYRDIRPNVYVSASFDGGESWSAPKPYLKPGEVSAGWPRLMPWRDQIAIAYETYPNDRAMDGKFTLQLLDIAEGAKELPDFVTAQKIDETERKARLVQRIKALWDNRIAGNYEPSYHTFDFAYKAATPLKYYLENVGVITYLTYSHEEPSIDGNQATVKMKLKYEVKPTTLPFGKTSIKVEPIEVDASNTWVWVGNDWYLVYSPSFGEPNLKY